MALNDLALQHLATEEIAEFGLSELKTLDDGAGLVFRALAIKITIPPALDCCSMSSAYDFAMPRLTGVFLDTLDMIYEAGFRSVDVPNWLGRTPLFDHLQSVD